MSVKSSKIGTLKFRCIIREHHDSYFYANCSDVNIKKVTNFLDRYTVDFVPRIGIFGVKVRFTNKTRISGVDNIIADIDKLIEDRTIVDIDVVAKINRCKIKSGRISTSISFLATEISTANIDAIERDMEKMRFM